MEFKTALSGYDRQQVDDAIDEYESDKQSLRKQVVQLQGEAAQLRQNAEAASLQAKEAAGKLETVQSQFDAFRRQATDRVNQLRDEASLYKKKTEELQGKADKPWAAAGVQAQKLVDAAEKQAEDILSEANEQAEQIKANAKAEADKLMADARAEAERQQERARNAISRVKGLSDTIGKVQQILNANSDGEPAKTGREIPMPPKQPVLNK